MSGQSFEEKTEKPTPKKRQDTRKKGEVAKSRELPSVAVLLSGIMALAACGPYMNTRFQIIMEKTFEKLPSKDLDVVDVMSMAQEMIGLFLLIIGPFLVAVFVAAIFSNVMQVGFMLSAESIKPKLSKLDPIKGFSRLFSMQSLMEFFKSISKLAIVGTVGYFSVKGELDGLPALVDMELKSIMAYILITTLKISLMCALAMIVLVVADYAFQKWQFEKKIRMTKKEIKDELKRSEGDPLIKSRIRSIQMEMARKRMMQDVPKADVIITNPTHLAVAISYDGISMSAPKILAKGAGEIARRIKEIAISHDIPVVENKELARNLYSQVDIGSEIPGSLYQAVAEILAYIYKLKKGNPAT
jgi:flagellar biosynthetic protein FlhB